MSNQTHCKICKGELDPITGACHRTHLWSPPKKGKKKTIYQGIRKETAPPTKVFKTRLHELPRKKKHKAKEEEV